MHTLLIVTPWSSSWATAAVVLIMASMAAFTRRHAMATSPLRSRDDRLPPLGRPRFHSDLTGRPMAENA